MNDETENTQLTFGDKAVGITFNPSSNMDVNEIKAYYAAIIDFLNDRRKQAEDGETARYYSVAITEAQTAQMWAVKAVTWGLPRE